jgi:hypothetical protein
MIKISLCFLVLLVNLLTGCSGKVNNEDSSHTEEDSSRTEEDSSRTEDSSHIIVIGTAINLKYAAGVISNEQDYYLDGVLSWDENMLGKRVSVKGELFVKIFPPIPPLAEVGPNDPPPPPPPDQLPGGFMLIIKNPKW